jgi:glycosyltransferase involved in cell wall biosynthesis
MTNQPEHFPRLLYIGDVPVDATTGGSAFVYRLLQGYPPGQLRVVEGSMWSSVPDKRLPNVAYDKLSLGPRRLLYSRLSAQYSGYLCLIAALQSYRLGGIVKSFQPEAVLTVAHGFLWQTAARLASRFDLPLHLNINDDWPRMNHLPQKMKNWGTQRFGAVYRMAASRWCASPFMAENYEREFGATGNVLYPLLAQEQVAFDAPKGNGSRAHSCVFAYAGSIHSQAYADSLLKLASVLEPSRSRLVVYSGLSAEAAMRFGLVKPNLELRSLVPASDLIRKLRNDADVLFIPMSFEPADLPNMKAAFPSKLPDCTAVGVPLLIWGPRECSAVRWSIENRGVAEVISENDTELLAQAVTRLVTDPDHRLQLAAAAIEKGRQYFSHATVTEKFNQSIRKQIATNQTVGIAPNEALAGEARDQHSTVHSRCF